MSETNFQRSGRHLRQFIKFGVVGGSGIVVNLAVTVVLKWLVPHYQERVFAIPATPFGVYWYHVIAVAAFVVANTWNYQLNRSWTFRATATHTPWWSGLGSFMSIGLVALAVGLGIQTLLLKTDSPLYLGRIDWLDDSNGLRTKLYWATLIQIGVTMPINFVVNKLWTFRSARFRRAVTVAGSDAE
ncbi:GtrA family protein [Tessaracoccus sp. SD287]|uniref:GtrA family protein n=1 Tax=Tessaracoccus sp. SD287 TaxID=2782008 RepID=UPI001A96680B|nr:GtrA family protein [Tessaracoccus sp. SD287]